MPHSLRDSPIRGILKRYLKDCDAPELRAIETCHAFVRTARDAYVSFEGYFAGYGLSQGRLRLLVQLANSGGQMSPCDLAERVGISRATVTGLLDGLDKAALIERIANPDDRRMVTIHITAAGEALLKDALPGHFRRMTELVSDLSEEEMQMLATLLAKIDSRAKALR